LRIDDFGLKISNLRLLKIYYRQAVYARVCNTLRLGSLLCGTAQIPSMQQIKIPWNFRGFYLCYGSSTESRP
jgi:hypothetical protein